VDFATGIGGVWTLLDAWDTLREKGPRRVMPMTVPMLMPNAAAGNLSLHFGARAFARTVASACASSTESIVNAVEHLQDGLADVVIAGGTESAVHPITIASFASMQALSRRNDSPETASRPASIDRDGFVMGEGAGVLILETEEHAKARGAKIYATVVGGGVTADSYHITANDPEGTGAARAVRMALKAADASPDDVTHINAHATSTPVGDPNEYTALRTVFGERVDEIPVSATKASTGHLLGGTGTPHRPPLPTPHPPEILRRFSRLCAARRREPRRTRDGTVRAPRPRRPPALRAARAAARTRHRRRAPWRSGRGLLR
jgi:3-oxoacyl-[acyl-carrier-protein] synthase II